MTETGHTDAMTTNLSSKPVVKFNPPDWFTNKEAISIPTKCPTNIFSSTTN